MHHIALHLADGLDVRCHCRVRLVRHEQNHREAITETGDIHTGKTLLLTPPVPRSLQLLDAGKIHLTASDFQVHRWRYSRPALLHPERCFVAQAGAGQDAGSLVFTGDAFGEARVEGAALSGKAAAAALLKLQEHGM